MTRIFDNIVHKLFPALTNTLVSAHRADFCVGFFNLRGWGLVANHVDHFAGGQGQCCRVLIGMNERPDDELRAALRLLKTDDGLDLQRAAQLRRQVAEAFRDQLTKGAPTNADERALQPMITCTQNSMGFGTNKVRPMPNRPDLMVGIELVEDRG